MIYLLVTLLVVYQLWVHFLAVMSLQAARNSKTLTPWGLRFGYGVLAIGYLFDFAGQLLGCLVFWELPPRTGKFPWIESTVSARVKRLIASGTGWRKARAEWYRDHLLKPFDRTGRHG